MRASSLLGWRSTVVKKRRSSTHAVKDAILEANMSRTDAKRTVVDTAVLHSLGDVKELGNPKH
jgi:hypothetical protein